MPLPSPKHNIYCSVGSVDRIICLTLQNRIFCKFPSTLLNSDQFFAKSAPILSPLQVLVGFLLVCQLCWRILATLPAVRPHQSLFTKRSEVILLMALLVFKDIDASVQKWAFCAAWGLGNGPLLCAIAVLGNSLLFHDFDNTSSVLIHLSLETVKNMFC